MQAGEHVTSCTCHTQRATVVFWSCLTEI